MGALVTLGQCAFPKLIWERNWMQRKKHLPLLYIPVLFVAFCGTTSLSFNSLRLVVIIFSLETAYFMSRASFPLTQIALVPEEKQRAEKHDVKRAFFEMKGKGVGEPVDI